MQVCFVLFLCLAGLACLLGRKDDLDVILYEFGGNLGSHVEKQLLSHLHSVPGLQVYPLESLTSSSEIEAVGALEALTGLNVLIMSFGSTLLSEIFVPLQVAPTGQQSEHSLQHKLESDSFRVFYSEPKPKPVDEDRQPYENFPILVSNGLPLDELTHTNISFDKQEVHYGAVTGAYASMELLGFAWLHPLEPHTPARVSMRSACARRSSKNSKSNNTNNNTEKQKHCSFSFTEEPTWPERSFHIHTQHPLELTEVLQGHDIPQRGPHGKRCTDFSQHKRRNLVRRRGGIDAGEEEQEQDKDEGVYCERWEDMVQDVNLLFEWAIANRLNKLEWLLLGNYKWGYELDTRAKRLRLLTDLGHKYSLMIGADVPLGNLQQHGWTMVNVRQPLNMQLDAIRSRVDWVFNRGFDFMTTESGLSEFTHPECDLMLDLLSGFAQHVNETWGREAGVKVHCSTGMLCEGYEDPRESHRGEPLNFNFLPYYAHKGLGVFPHTIQPYSLDDPTAGAYGNANFSYMEDYLVLEAKAGNRSVMFYPETAYWVNVDVDVPLFLPLYGQRRQHDLRRLRHRERTENFKMQGQMNFDSGWEWGYWLSDVITARASWDPLVDPSFAGAVKGGDPMLTVWEAFEEALLPLVRVFDHLEEIEGDRDDIEGEGGGMNASCAATEVKSPSLSEQLATLLVQLSKDQARLLIHGSVDVIHEQNSTTPDMDIDTNTEKSGTEAEADGGSWWGWGSKSESSRDRVQVVKEAKKNRNPLTGIAYLSGGDTWSDLPHMMGMPSLQPAKVHIRETSDQNWPRVLPLLREMDKTFGEHLDSFSALYERAQAAAQSAAAAVTKSSQVLREEGEVKVKIQALDRARQFFAVKGHTHAHPNSALGEWKEDPALLLLEELVDCVSLLALRTKQVRLLYESKDADRADSQVVLSAGELQQQSRSVLAQAERVVRRREKNYRTAWQRVGAWRDNPTVYRYGYLWAVHSLYYWWRDQGLAEEGSSMQSQFSPCYLNRIDATETAQGWGKSTLELFRKIYNKYSPFRVGYPLELLNCLSPPADGYEFPRDLFYFEF